MPNTKPKLIFHPKAVLDLDEAAEWYEAQKTGLGYEFLSEYEKLTKHIVTFPKMFPVLENKVRKAILSRFPYLVLYKNNSDHIFIIAVMHSKRHPDYWKHRTIE